MTTHGYQFYHIDQLSIEYPINDGINTHLLGYAGLGMHRLQVATERLPYERGVTMLGEPYLSDREVQLAIDIQDTTHVLWVTRDRALRNNLSPFKKPSDLCILKTVCPDDAIRYLDAWLVEYLGGDEGMDGPVYGKRSLTYWAPDPAFYNPTAIEVSFGAQPGGGMSFPFTFPLTFVASADVGGFTFPFTFPLTFTAAGIDSRQTLDYAGSLPAKPIIRCYGPGDNWRLESVTEDKWLKVVQELDSGDYLDVDMSAPDGLIATWYDATDASSQDVTSLLADGSQLWKLRPGENEVHVTSDGTVSGGVRMTYYDRYLAI